MLLCNLTTVIKWRLLFGILSILTLGDATDNSTTENITLVDPNIVHSTSLISIISKPTSEPVHTTKNVLLSPTNSTAQMKAETSVMRGISTTLASEANNISTIAPVLQTSQITMSNTTSGSTADIVTETTTRLTSTYSSTFTISPATIVEETTLRVIAAPSHIECGSLEKLESNLEVVCFQYPEYISCDTLEKEKLKSLLCDKINITQCNITFYFSKVNAKCILWVPTSAGKILKENGKIFDQETILLKWGYVSEYVTPWRKVTIALVTCGVLLAAFILAGYFLSNRESWSPGRQRLGEDPYYTETDSQGNTLVSVSAYGQDKPNTGTRENGTGQVVTPASTNGHSTKKQTVSDTEL
ncbi:hematopoietic progenitor cell antigen CD34 isoform X2 [Pseudophryne corroboree]|uniref:hematopoietic progenitor cell antigen CD34 isoform X2 n=1 Tax=Pseudophryne corroboree TaxID=495146 RepID=UPI00308154B6